MKDRLLIIGVMTGNSLDAADVVLTAFYRDGRIEDRASFSLPSPPGYLERFVKLRDAVKDSDGRMDEVAATYPDFDALSDDYIRFVAEAVEGLLRTAGISANDVDLIGLHGQTCAHKPPSLCAAGETPYTVQLGDGKKLAELTGISVAFDFRSDDVLAGGEGAPLAPMHNKHIAESLGHPVTFINGGNTSNLAHIVGETVYGWDAGPFNHFPDMLMRLHYGESCDRDGKIGCTGKINEDLLRQLFSGGAVTEDGRNFLELPRPKSSDPRWYRSVPLLEDDTIPPQDKVRTAEYFAAYLTYHTLGHTPTDIMLPSQIAVFGGGWNNPVTAEDFRSLLNGAAPLILPEHQLWFDGIAKRFDASPVMKRSSDYGIDGAMMEARIFADLACSLILGRTFTTPATTGVRKPAVCGVIAYADLVTENLKSWSEAAGTSPPESHARWGRASGR